MVFVCSFRSFATGFVPTFVRTYRHSIDRVQKMSISGLENRVEVLSNISASS